MGGENVPGSPLACLYGAGGQGAYYLLKELGINREDDTEKGGDDPEKKTSCFGGFCLSLQVKLASISTKSPENTQAAF